MNRQRRFLTFALLTLSLAAFKQAASAQTAQITGLITDANLAAVAGAEVTLTSVDTGVARKTVTNAGGYYSIPFAPPGNYRLNVLANSFKPVNRDGVSLNVDQVARLDFRLEIGVINEGVNITGDGPQLEREPSASGQCNENKNIAKRPANARNKQQP